MANYCHIHRTPFCGCHNQLANQSAMGMHDYYNHLQRLAASQSITGTTGTTGTAGIVSFPELPLAAPTPPMNKKLLLLES